MWSESRPWLPTVERKTQVEVGGGSHGREEKAPVIYSDLLIFRRKLIKLIPAKTLSGQIEEKQIENCGYLGQRESS